MPSYAIVGASRGIGLGFIRKLSTDPENVIFALVRNPEGSKDLQAIAAGKKNIHVVQLDLVDLQSIKRAADSVAKVTGGFLDVLINNAAALFTERTQLKVTEFPSAEVLETDLLSFFQTNVIGVTHTTNAFLPLIRQGKKKRISFISSSIGSPIFVLNAAHADAVDYCVSKSALNMIATKFALALKDEGITVLLVSPGLVKTMQGPQEETEKFYTNFVAEVRKAAPQYRGALTVEQTVEEQLALLEKVTLEDTGKFLHSSGQDANLVETEPSA